jgi:hypothetical protein
LASVDISHPRVAAGQFFLLNTTSPSATDNDLHGGRELQDLQRHDQDAGRAFDLTRGCSPGTLGHLLGQGRRKGPVLSEDEDAAREVTLFHPSERPVAPSSGHRENIALPRGAD